MGWIERAVENVHFARVEICRQQEGACLAKIDEG
jgi:hypothetical protein